MTASSATKNNVTQQFSTGLGPLRSKTENWDQDLCTSSLLQDI